MEYNQRTVRVLLPLSIRSYKMVGFDTSPFSPHMQHQGVMAGSRAWLDDWEAGWMELLW